MEDDKRLIPHSNNSTSRDAAISMTEHAQTQRNNVYLYIKRNNGATCDEIERALSLRHSSTSARIWEMNYILKTIFDSGETRCTQSGRKAIVWKPTLNEQEGSGDGNE